MTYHLIIYDTINGQSGLKDNMHILLFPTTPKVHYKSVDDNLLFNVTKGKKYHIYWTIMRVDMYVSVEWDK